MARRLILLFAAAIFVTAKAPGALSSDPVDLTVHEWGTFTSVAGADGKAVDWLPQSGPPDLPSFVEHVGYNTKGCLSGTVRMETPVLYFYAAQETSVDVRVRFTRGAITEWYPHAAVFPRVVSDATLRNPAFVGEAAWSDVKVAPHASPADFPNEHGASHYYAARETDASPLQVDGHAERFLFYRGVGRFDPPLLVTRAADGTIGVEATNAHPIGDVVLFENRGGRIGYSVRRLAAPFVELEPLELRGDVESLYGHLEQLLVARGLYPKEAAAMVATWRDSWFDEGARLFYILPQDAVDRILPLEIDPAPAAVARVFVGRIEIITPEIERTVGDAIVAGDHGAIAKHSRFIRPIVDRLRARRSPSERAALEQRLSAVYSRLAPLAGCR